MLKNLLKFRKIKDQNIPQNLYNKIKRRKICISNLLVSTTKETTKILEKTGREKKEMFLSTKNHLQDLT